MIHFYSGDSADEIWGQLAFDLCHTEKPSKQVSRIGHTRDLGRVVVELTCPRNRWTLSRRPSMNPAFAIAEVIWMIAGRNDSAFLNFFNRSLPKFAGEGQVYDGAYGHRLRRHHGIDQIERAYRTLQNCGHTRQVVLQIWDAESDLPAIDGTPASPDVPCNVVSFLKIRNGVLEWTQVMRSNDLFRGLPYNFVQFTTLHEIIAGWLAIPLGTFSLVADSMHAYESDLRSIASANTTSRSDSFESLYLPKDDSESYFEEMTRIVDQLINPTLSTKRLLALTTASELPTPFVSMLHLLVAEALRRRNEDAIACELMSTCQNRTFQILWNNWVDRFEGRQNEEDVQGGVASDEQLRH